MNIKSQVYCTLVVEGIHCWSDCPIDEVKYLRYPHRHLFYIKAHVNVDHDDRFVEFIELKHQIKTYLIDRYYDTTFNCCNFNTMSCEMIARELIEWFDLTCCEVSEDNENGCILTIEQ